MASSVSVLRANAPQLRTKEAIIEKYEQIQDALEHGLVTPKTGEQMNQTLKGIIGMANMEMRWVTMLLKFGRKVPVPQSPLLRSVSGLTGPAGPEDRRKIQEMLPE